MKQNKQKGYETFVCDKPLRKLIQKHYSWYWWLGQSLSSKTLETWRMKWTYKRHRWTCTYLLHIIERIDYVNLFRESIEYIARNKTKTIKRNIEWHAFPIVYLRCHCTKFVQTTQGDILKKWRKIRTTWQDNTWQQDRGYVIYKYRKGHKK